jgi:polar amino acid transport system substrate-binding protein
MVSTPIRITITALLISLNIWIWALGGTLFWMRWHSIDRPLPHIRELFPYGEMRVGVDASFPPFAVATADDLFGLDIDVGNAIGEQLGIPVRFVNMGYDGLYDSVKADLVDVVISALLVDPAKTAEVRYTRHYFNNGLLLVTNPDNSWNSIEAIENNSIAYEFGSPADAELRLWQRRLTSFEQQPYELPDYALDALRLNHVDSALVDATSFRVYLREHPTWQPHITPVTDAWYAIAIRIDRVETWQAVNQALNELDKAGHLDEILARWL